MASTPKATHLKEIKAEDLTTAIDEPAALISPRYPQRVHRGEGNWPIVASALVAQMLSAAQSIGKLFALEAHNDVRVVLRTLYEQVVTFCWLAIDPDRNLIDWANEAHRERLKLHNDARSFGHPILTEEEAAEIKTRRGMPSLAERAAAVDEFWPKRISGFRGYPEQGPRQILTLRGLYAGLYRTTSRAAHAHVGSLDAFVDQSRYPRYPAVVHLRSTPSDLAPVAVPLVTLALLVCHYRLRWPDTEQVLRLNAALLHNVDVGSAVDTGTPDAGLPQ